MKILQWRYTPVLTAVVVLLYLVWAGHQRVVTANQGHLVYAVDDAYIHMAMAKNLVNHGVLGVTPEGFTSSSSSIIWPLLLGLGYLLWGVNDWMPLALNIVFAIASLAVIGFYLRQAGARGWLILGLLLAAVFLMPAVPLIYCGMEHHLHAFAAICLTGSLWRVLSSTSAHPVSSKLMLMTAALVTASRYEGLMMVGVVCVCLYLEQRRSLALRVGIAGAAAPVAFAVLSLSRGWSALPNSVLLKGAMPAFGATEDVLNTLGLRSLRQLLDAPHVFVLVISAAILLTIWSLKREGVDRQSGGRRALGPLLALLLCTTLLHMQFAKTGSFIRYESYLVLLGVFVLGLASTRFRPRLLKSPYGYAAAIVLGIVLAYPLALRATWAHQNIARATQNIYQQQYQIGTFLRTYYPQGAIVLNDIGAPSYLADIRILDVSGLATQEVADMKRAGGLTREQLASLARQGSFEFAILFEAPYIPEDWVEVARWKISQNLVCWRDTVSFYVIDPDVGEKLVENLRAFCPSLPDEVGYQVAGDPPRLPRRSP